MKNLKILFMVALFSLAPAALVFAAQQPMIAAGQLFPEIELQLPADGAGGAYLNLSGATKFTPSQIDTEVLLVELLNVHCPHCQMQTASYNELFRLIEADPATRGKIKMLAIAVGNLDWEVENFRRAYQVEFPIFTDTNFTAWRAVGGSSTPFSIYVRQDEPGKPGLVTGTHLGLNTHYVQLHQRLAKLAVSDLNSLSQVPLPATKAALVTPLFSEQQREYRVRSALTHLGGILRFAKLDMQSGRQVYAAEVKSGDGVERLFAEITSRTSVCDICHDVHFIYLFDRTTKIVGFEPLQLTKYGNVNWNAAEVATMRNRVVGRYLARPQPFDPKVDAISSATMTSAIIFDSLAQGEELVSELREMGWL